MLQRPAISYVDEDYATHRLTYGELLQYCREMMKQLSEVNIPKALPRSSVIRNVKTGDRQQPGSFRLLPIIVLYGECSQLTPVFMTAISHYGAAFYSVERQEQLKEALRVLPPNTVVAIIAHAYRIDELKTVLQATGKVIRKMKGFVLPHSEYYIVCLKETLEVNVADSTASNLAPIQLPIAYLINTSGTSGSLAAAATVTAAAPDVANGDTPPQPSTSTSSTSSSSSCALLPTTKYVFVPAPAILNNILDFSARFSLQPDSVLLLCSPFTFDPALCDAFLGLSAGAHIVLVCNSLRNSANRMRLIIMQFGVTYATMTASHWRMLTSACPVPVLRELLATFRQLNFGGELGPSKAELSAISNIKPKLCIFNLYGATEVSAWASLTPFSVASLRESSTENYHILAEQYYAKHLPISGRRVRVHPDYRFFVPMINTVVEVKGDTEEICIHSPVRRCLIYTPAKADGQSTGSSSSSNLPPQWTYLSTHFTGDRGRKHACKTNAGNYNIYYNFRLVQDDVVKVNGIKCYLSEVGRFMREYFRPVNPRNHGITVVHSLATVADWHAWPKALIDLTLVYEKAATAEEEKNKNKKDDRLYCSWQTRLHVAVILAQKFGKNFAFRLHLHDVATVGADVLNASGKLDTGRLQALALRRSRRQTYFHDNLLPKRCTSKMPSKEKELVKGHIKAGVTVLLFSVLKHLHQNLATLTDSGMVDLNLNALGVSSIGRLQFAVELESAFAEGFAGLDAEAMQAFFDIVNSCSIGRIVQYVQALFEEEKPAGPAGPARPAQQAQPTPAPAEPAAPKPPAAVARIEPKAPKPRPVVQVSQLSHRVKVFEGVEELQERIVEPYSCTPQWSYFMEECVDSTPLIVIYQGVTYLITASHSGMVAALDAYSSSGDGPQQQPYRVLWTRHLLSRIDSGPVASTDGRLTFLCPRSAHLMALATATGDTVWSVLIDSSVRNSPTVVGSRVLAGSHNGRLFCCETERGLVLWSADLEAGGIVASPVLYHTRKSPREARVLVATVTGLIAGLALDTGVILWRLPFSTGSRYESVFATPLVMGHRAVVCLVQERIVCVSLGENPAYSKNRTHWSVPIARPVTSGGAGIVVNRGGDHFCSPVGVRLPDGRQAAIVATHCRAVYCVDVADGKVLWCTAAAASIHSVPFLVGHGVIVVDTIGNLQLLDVFTGKAIAARAITSAPGNSSDGGDGNDEGEGGDRKKSRCTSFRISKWKFGKAVHDLCSTSDQPKEVDQLRLTPMVHSSPILHQGKLFIGARDNYLHCFTLNLSYERDGSITDTSRFYPKIVPSA